MKEFLEALKEERVRKWISTILDVESTEVSIMSVSICIIYCYRYQC